MIPEVEKAIEEIKTLFDGHRVEIIPEEQGGAHVVIHDLDIGTAYVPQSSWCGFTISYQYPRGQVYPHYLDPSVQRADGQALSAGFFPNQSWPAKPGQTVLMVSRGSNRWNMMVDTAATKLMQVLDWVSTR